METFNYDGTSSSLQKAIDVHERRGIVTCHICGSELIVIVGNEDAELARKHQLKPGIYCPTNPKHMHKVFIFSDKFEEFRRRFGLDE
ncbi:MAG: hypothetical protein HC907_38585 [Richelia sp. SM1_7_0]|nr:hypothetical protein [Richelia sp. SM1_7_0]